MTHVDKILRRLENSGLNIQPKECSFGINCVKFQGHKVSYTGVALDPEKLQAILKYSILHNRKLLSGWLGTVNYFGKFGRNDQTIRNSLLF